MELALLLSINCSFAIISCWQPDTPLNSCIFAINLLISIGMRSDA